MTSICALPTTTCVFPKAPTAFVGVAARAFFTAVEVNDTDQGAQGGLMTDNFKKHLNSLQNLVRLLPPFLRPRDRPLPARRFTFSCCS